MVDFEIHDESSAPQDAKDVLRQAEEDFGMLPNIFGAMAESPTELKAYMSLSALLEETTLTVIERNVVLLAISFENECDYCMAAHSAVAQQLNVPLEIIEAVRNGDPIEDGKLESLRSFAAEVMCQRGHLPDAEVEVFLSAGYMKENILKIVLAVAMKTISNYTNHIADTPLDQAMKAFRWEPPEKS